MSESALRKIKALRAKSAETGATEAEAMSAAAKAEELMEKYGVSDEDISRAESEDLIGEGSWRNPTKTVHPVVKYTAMSIAAFAEVRCWTNTAGDDRWITLKFFGFHQDVEMAIYLTEAFAAAYNAEWKRYCQDNPATSGVSRHKEFWSFTGGMGGRLRDRLRDLIIARKKNYTETATSGTALVVKKLAMVDAAKAGLGLTIREGRRHNQKMDPNAYYAGAAAGDKVNLSRPVGGSSGGGRYLT
jgi:hypothetical protein